MEELSKWKTQDEGQELEFHLVTPEDKAVTSAMRNQLEANKGRLRGAAARGPYDEIMNRVIAPAQVTYDAGTVGGVPGWWCRPEAATA